MFPFPCFHVGEKVGDTWALERYPKMAIAHRTKVRTKGTQTTTTTAGSSKAKQPIRNAPLCRVFFLLHISINIHFSFFFFLLLWLLYFTRRTETQFIFSLAIRFPRRVARKFFSFLSFNISFSFSFYFIIHSIHVRLFLGFVGTTISGTSERNARFICWSPSL